MGQISATGFSFNTSFHDYYNYQPTYTSEHWRLDITSDSQAVHQCKKASDLSDALTLLCGQTFNQTTL
jgi:hypothetical protein